jgi:DNA-binding NarL/FixJ family response regulator
MIHVALASPSTLIRAGLADGLHALGDFTVVLAAATLAELAEAGFGDAEVAVVDVAEDDLDLDLAAGAGPHFVLLGADADERVGERRASSPGFDVLTPRERQVLAAMSNGLGNREIGGALGISAHTAKFHVAQIIAKLQAQSRAHAVAKALRAGFVDA